MMKNRGEGFDKTENLNNCNLFNIHVKLLNYNYILLLQICSPAFYSL